MLQLNLQAHGVTVEQLRELAVHATFPQERKRYLLLYNLALDQSGATSAGKKAGFFYNRAAKVVHRFNQGGLDAMKYRHTGGARPLFLSSKKPSSAPNS